MESWRDIEGYEGLYQISNVGRVYSVPRIDTMNVKRGGIYLTPSLKKNGKYCRVPLSKNNTTRLVILSHLVARAFPEICGAWFDGCEVHHKNYDSLDNRAENLIVLSVEEHNKLHSLSKNTWNNRSASQKKAWETREKRIARQKAVMQFDLEGNYLNTFASLKEAGKKTNTNIPSLCLCLKGANKTAGGYLWKYA